MTNKLTKEEWLARCAMVYDLGMVEHLHIAERGMNYFMRSKPLEVALSADTTEEGMQEYRSAEQQEEIAKSIMSNDVERTVRTLANDRDAYKALEAMNILTKRCQKCATDPECWHCRGCMFGCKIKR
jgi:hypothetical protein